MKVYVFGEILFDVYPNEAIIGGAPFNFASHLAKLGNDTALISAIGADALGEKALHIAESHGTDLSKMQTNAYATGVCNVTLDADGVPSYRLLEDVAYDHIHLTDADIAKMSAKKDKMLYFGTLAMRNANSRLSLQRLVTKGDFDELLYDINIRPPFYDKDSIEFGLSHCSILKLSREEASIFTRLELSDTDYLLPLCQKLCRQYPNIHTVLLTLDADGAVVYDAKTDHFTPSAVPKCKVVSTVGAGDAFFAGYVHGLLFGKSVKACLQNAILLSSYVVEHTEAVPAYTDALLDQLKQA